MFSSSSLVLCEELTELNLEVFLEEQSFVDFFNTFLALPCFQQKLFYNKEAQLFEEFYEKLADDVGTGDARAASALRQFTHFKGTIYNVSSNKARMGYYVNQLNKDDGFNFIKNHRLQLFLRSELYAEYKLSRILAQGQECYLRDIHSDDDSGVELAVAVLQRRGRRQSAVCFKLYNSEDDTSSADEKEENVENEGEFYLPGHYNTIEETFDAWRESSKKSRSRTSTVGSYRSILRNPARKTPESEKTDNVVDDVETQSSSSCYSRQETDVSYSRNSSERPGSGISVMSDKLNNDVGETWCDSSHNSAKNAQERSEVIQDAETNSREEDNVQHLNNMKQSNRTKDTCSDRKVRISPRSGMNEKNELTEHVTDIKEKDREITSNSPDTELAKKSVFADYNDLTETSAESNRSRMNVYNAVGNTPEAILDASNYELSYLPVTEESLDDSNGVHSQLDMAENRDLDSSVSCNECSAPTSKKDTEEEVFEALKTVDEDNSEEDKEVEEITNISLSLKVLDSHSLERNTSFSSEYKTYSGGSCISSTLTSPIPAEGDSTDITKVIQPNSEEKQVRGQEQEKPFISLTTVDESTRDVSGSDISPNQQQSELGVPEHEKEHEEDDQDGSNTDADQASFTTLQGIQGILGSRRRFSIAATSVGFDDQDSIISDDGWDEENAPYDMTKKAAFDAFKEFLLDTNGEKQFRFWLDSECAKHLQYEEEKTLLIKNMQDKYLRCGGVFEFSLETKRRLMLEDATKLTFSNLFATQDAVLEPILNYWCPRFTMHQQRHRSNPDLEYLKSMEQRPHSCVRRENELSNLPQSVLHAGLDQLTPNRLRMRPHSSVVHESGKSQPQTSKSHLRAKSAHPRLVHSVTPVHTNASTIQLQLATAPMRKSYGFNEPKMAAFPSGPAPDYASSVRLFIQPVPSLDCKPQRILRRLQRTSYNSSESQTLPDDVPDHGEKSALDPLIQGLIHERQTGQLLELFLIRQGNQLWLNCLAFWKSLQEYNAYFYTDSLNPFALARKARYMYANFIIPGSCSDLQLHEDIREQVRKELDPPYEELFDTVEEHVLLSLLEPWTMLQGEDESTYSKVNKEQKLRHIELKIVTRRRQSIMETVEHEIDDDGSDKERISVDEANRPLPVPKDGFTFESLIRNRTEVELFKEFLSKKHTKGVKDLMAWTDMETFRRIPRYMEEKRDNKAKEVRTSWLTKKYFFGPESPATREGQNMVTTINGGREIKERPISPVIFESQKFVRARIERRWLMMFKQTAEFIERQKPRNNVQEIVEDVLLKRRLQRSEAAWKILNSRWVSSSRDVVALRQTLLNSATCAQFRTFVLMKGETFDNDVQFWLEVQRFKDLCHAHAQESLIRKKVQTIVECFLNSAISPELPIDIPMEMGDKLLDRLTGRSPSVHPYVFREAQTTVFRVLFNHWKDFVSYRSKIPEGQDQLQYLEEQLKKHRAETKAKKEASERRRLTRLSAERKKREKEERDRRREDLTSLFSLETASIFQYNDEDDVNSWYYSKHVVEQERQEHMARLREQGIELPEEVFYERSTANTDDAKSRRSKSSKSRTKVSEEKPAKLPVQEKGKGSTASTAEKPPNKLVSSLKNPTAGSSYRRGSVVSFRRGSSVSIALTHKEITSDKNSAILEEDHEELGQNEHKTLGGTPQGERYQDSTGKDIRKGQSKAFKKEFVAEIQVIPEETELALPVSKISPLKIPQPNPARDQVKDTGNLKLLASRSQKTPRRLSASKHETLKDRKGGVPLDAISCISDYSAISNIDYMPKKSHSKTVRAGKTLALTSKSLKDFTNSPEGAPLSMPLPLVRITSASHVDTSVEGESLAEPHTFFGKPRPHSMSQTLQDLSRLAGRTRGRRRVDRESRNVKSAPDVIVN